MKKEWKLILNNYTELDQITVKDLNAQKYKTITLYLPSIWEKTFVEIFAKDNNQVDREKKDWQYYFRLSMNKWMKSSIYYNNCIKFSELKKRIKDVLRKENFKEKKIKAINLLSEELELELTNNKQTWIEFITKEVKKIEGWSLKKETNSVRIETANVKGYDGKAHTKKKMYNKISDMLDDYKSNNKYHIDIFVNDVGDYENDLLGTVIIIKDN